MSKRHLKVAGDLGKIVFMVRSISTAGKSCERLISLQEYDLRNTQSLEESVRHSDCVYNLVGREYPTKYVLTAPSELV